MRNDFESNYLAHYGILGMKWGVRRYQNADGSLTAEGKERYGSGGNVGETISKKAKTARNILRSDSGSRSSKALKEARRKDMDELTTQELREINNRLNEEQRYLNLTRGMTSSGKKFATQVGTQIATAIITTIAIEAGKKYVKSKLGM
jgi:tRNA(Glu) U13 pseudouridine synthase TruD